MRKKSHISLAKYIVEDIQAPELLEHRNAFYLGSILPDCMPSFVTTRHEFDVTFGKVKEQIASLTDDSLCYEQNSRAFARRLGQIIHYVADYFTFPHNKIYPGSMKDHCYYEKDLKYKLREFVKSPEAFQTRIDGYRFRTKEALFQYIRKAHDEYLKRKHSVEEDCRYIVQVCHQVVQAILQLAKMQSCRNAACSAA